MLSQCQFKVVSLEKHIISVQTMGLNYLKPVRKEVWDPQKECSQNSI